MRKEIKVTIPEPCHEDWNLMTPQEKGRHCAVCNKTVVDFTNKTDEYIVKTFEKEGKLCGRFKCQQLDRPLAYSRKESRNYLAVAASSALAFLTFGTQFAKAQGNSQIKTEVVKSNQVKGKIAHSVLKNRVVSGRVIGNNNLPLVNVQVSQKGTNNLTTTDKNGDYTLKVSNYSTLLFSHENHQDFEVLVADSNSISVEMVEGESKTFKNGKLIITGVITDENGLPLPSATVIEKGTTNGTSTDFDGNYTLEVDDNATIIASYIGYEDMEIKVESSNSINFSLDLGNYLGGTVGIVVCHVSNGEEYEYIPTPEEIAEAKRLNDIRRTNNTKFYKRKFKEALADRKRKRKERRANKNN